MLLEALGPSLTTLDMAPEGQLETLGALLSVAWQVPRAIVGRHANAMDKALVLHQFLLRSSDTSDARHGPSR